MSSLKRVIIMGAAGRDFHNFNVHFRKDQRYRVEAFTAFQIPGIAGRVYPPALAGEGAVLVDLGSKNGTLLGGRRIEEPTRLGDGDEIRIGPALLVFCAPGAGSTRTRRSSPA